MNYVVKSFVPAIEGNQNGDDAAKQLQALINRMQAQDWTFVSVENITTVVKGNQGCFGIGSTPNEIRSNQMVIFKK